MKVQFGRNRLKADLYLQDTWEEWYTETVVMMIVRFCPSIAFSWANFIRSDHFPLRSTWIFSTLFHCLPFLSSVASPMFLTLTSFSLLAQKQRLSILAALRLLNSTPTPPLERFILLSYFAFTAQILTALTMSLWTSVFISASPNIRLNSHNVASMGVLPINEKHFANLHSNLYLFISGSMPTFKRMPDSVNILSKLNGFHRARLDVRFRFWLSCITLKSYCLSPSSPTFVPRWLQRVCIFVCSFPFFTLRQTMRFSFICAHRKNRLPSFSDFCIARHSGGDVPVSSQAIALTQPLPFKEYLRLTNTPEVFTFIFAAFSSH